MKLYHASTEVVECPDVAHSRPNLDFGRGFYLTSLPEQAVRYAERFTRRGKPAFVSEYELDDDVVDFVVKRFRAMMRTGWIMCLCAVMAESRSSSMMLWREAWPMIRCSIR